MLRYSTASWYQSKPDLLARLLMPLSYLFRCIVAIRKWCYVHRILKSSHASVPVIVVGNITVGGTGKTPCVTALAAYLKKQGFKPGIVSRGVGGTRRACAEIVAQESDVNRVGDEAILLMRATQCPMVVCCDRVSAIHALLAAHPECNVIISDDGLQHYRMQRDVEIVVIDGDRRFGNRQLLPAGPLREPVSRLKSADFLVVNDGHMQNAYSMSLSPVEWVSLRDGQRRPLSYFSGKDVHVAAAIGNPSRFFATVSDMCGSVMQHSFPDHFKYRSKDLNFNDKLPVLMTRKDAVKYERFADDRHWYLDVDVRLDDAMFDAVIAKIS